MRFRWLVWAVVLVSAAASCGDDGASEAQGRTCDALRRFNRSVNAMTEPSDLGRIGDRARELVDIAEEDEQTDLLGLARRLEREQARLEPAVFTGSTAEVDRAVDRVLAVADELSRRCGFRRPEHRSGQP